MIEKFVSWMAGVYGSHLGATDVKNWNEPGCRTQFFTKGGKKDLRGIAQMFPSIPDC